MKKAKSVFMVLLVALAAGMVTSCQKDSDQAATGDACCPATGELAISSKPFGTTADGQNVDIYTLSNSNGIKAQIMTYGGIMVTLETKDREGKFGNILLGFDDLEGYFGESPYFGALIGRYGNRIASGKFTLDGVEYTLAQNDNGNHLHGGLKGFDKVVWTAEPVKSDDSVALKLHYVSKDMEEGYPGNLDVTMTYTLTNKDELIFDYEATTDKATVVNLTNHNYYNFNGGKSDILDHVLMVNADNYTPVVEGLIPTGEIAPVKGTPFDFTIPTAIGARVNDDNEQLKLGGGYDHNFVLNQKNAGEMTLAADVYDPATGRGMEIHTQEPGVQFYCGNFLDGTLKGHNGDVYNLRFALCLETQHFPDSPNQPDFPSTVLKPGETYKTRTIQKFYTK
ncbi:MAG: galactose mutarotase [Sedimentisphaerales bacterium]|nr:galactose mutarotase [Sedimentisphaerales bacterium]MBN2844292.1 galactose mutarotase [Sedimentisphaerales bacterium]